MRIWADPLFRFCDASAIMLYHNNPQRFSDFWRVRSPMEPIEPDDQALVVARTQRELWTLVIGRFHELEAEVGLRQVDLADRLGVSRPQIHEWLSDPQKMTIKAAGRLMAAMDARVVFDIQKPHSAPRRRKRALASPTGGSRSLSVALLALASATLEFGPVAPTLSLGELGSAIKGRPTATTFAPARL